MTRLNMLRAVPVIALSMVVAVACSDDSTGSDDGITGTYELVTANGVSVPGVVLEEEGVTFEILDGAITLSGSGTFTASVTTRVTVFGSAETETDVTSGTYTVSGNTITFVDPEGTEVGTRSGNRITVTVEEDDGGFTFVFEK